MNERIKQIRTSEGMSQQKFADRLKIARGNIAAYEVGKNAPSDAVIALICKEFSINEEWLRTGQGEMKRQRTRNEQVIEFTNDALESIDESFKKKLLIALSKLTEQDWERLADMAERILKE